MAGRILVIRGGAIGDFILTLPALHLLRENFPGCHVEILGYRHICALAERRFYADATRSIEYGPLAGFFNPKAEADPELSAYFASFQQIISYLYDPDELFATCLRRAGVKNLLCGSPKVPGTEHAARHLARPLEQMALFLDDPAARIYPSEDDLTAAGNLLDGLDAPVIALHPGSGSATKNWPLEHWEALVPQLLARPDIGTLLVVGGESDTGRLDRLRTLSHTGRMHFLENLPLTTLGAVLARCRAFVGHDSGISHLAAASGTHCLLLFGPTNPAIWAPANQAVRVLRENDLAQLQPGRVMESLLTLLHDAA